MRKFVNSALVFVLSAIAIVWMGELFIATADAGTEAPPAVVNADVPDNAAVGKYGPLMVIPADEVSGAMWDRLIDAGYHGYVGDGMDALYVPMVDAVESCYSDSDCHIATHYFMTANEDGSATIGTDHTLDANTGMIRPITRF